MKKKIMDFFPLLNALISLSTLLSDSLSLQPSSTAAISVLITSQQGSSTWSISNLPTNLYT